LINTELAKELPDLVLSNAESEVTKEGNVRGLLRNWILLPRLTRFSLFTRLPVTRRIITMLPMVMIALTMKFTTRRSLASILRLDVLSFILLDLSE